MSLISSIVDPVLRLNGIPAYALVGGLAFSEAALFVGFVLPGETAVLLGGVLAHEHKVSLTAMLFVAIIAAIAGDSVGFEVGRHYGARILGLRVFDNHREALERGQKSLRDKGGRAVFIARFTAFLRAVMPGLAGTSQMRYRKFLIWNAAGGIVWGGGFTLLGYLAGASYKKIETIAGRASEAILAVVVLAVVVFILRRRRAESDGGGEQDGAAQSQD